MSSYIAIQDTPKVRKWSRKRRGQGANVHAESKPSTSHNCSAAVDLLRFFSLARFLDIDTFTDEERIHERETHWQLLGVGACFEVRKALHPSSRSEFAVKTAANEVAGDGKLRAEHMKSLTTELRVMGHPQLRSHRNVIDLLGIIWDSDHNRDPPVVPFLAVEFSRIGTMNSLVNQKTLSFSIKMRLCRDVAAGINALHASNIIHADIKLQNVLIFKDPNSELVAKISDFSSALLSFDEGIRTVNIAKSRPWNAPETDCAMTILAKDIRKIDIFSYGMLFWRTILNGWLDVLSTEEMVCNEVEGMKDRGTLVKDAVMSLRGVKNMDPAQTRNAVSVLESTLQLNPDKRIGRLDYITNLLATPDHAHKTEYVT